MPVYICQQFHSDAFDSQAPPPAAAHKSISNSYAGTNNSFSVFPETTQQLQQLQQLQQQQQAISTLMRGLVEADHELVEAERRAARHSRSAQVVHGHSHKHRSSSRIRAANSNNREKDNREEANPAPITVRDLGTAASHVHRMHIFMLLIVRSRARFSQWARRRCIIPNTAASKLKLDGAELIDSPGPRVLPNWPSQH